MTLPDDPFDRTRLAWRFEPRRRQDGPRQKGGGSDERYSW